MNKKIIILMIMLAVVFSLLVNKASNDLRKIITKENLITLGKEIKDIKKQIDEE